MLFPLYIFPSTCRQAELKRTRKLSPQWERCMQFSLHRAEESERKTLVEDEPSQLSSSPIIHDKIISTITTETIIWSLSSGRDPRLDAKIVLLDLIETFAWDFRAVTWNEGEVRRRSKHYD